MIKEACVETLAEAIEAEKRGASRIELCSRLDLDGLTPDLQLFQKVRKAIELPIHVMIRVSPVGFPDSFILSENDLLQMEAQIMKFKSLGANGFVFGALDQERKVAIEQISRLGAMLDHQKLIFHKAIDLCIDPVAAAVELERETTVTDILTSGGASSACEGRQVILKMKQQLKRINVIAAGGINDQNLPSLHAFLSAASYHGRNIVGSLSSR